MTVLRRLGLLAPLAAFSLAGCGLNSVPTAEEQVNAAWGNLQADYQRRADLVRSLEALRVPILGQQHNAYYWIRIHTGVEAEHFDAALKGVNNALRFYVGSRPVESVKADILDGFSRFAAVQSGFMTALGEA